MKTANIALETEFSNYSTEPMAQVKQKLATVGRTFRTWIDRASTRRALRELSPEMLRDIGLDRCDAIDEANMPFWRV